MDFFASSRWQRLVPAQRSEHRIWQRATVFVAGSLVAVASVAQVSKTHIPDAPSPNPPVLNGTLSNNAARHASAIDSSAPIFTPPADAISLYTVVDLALRNSRVVRIAEAEERRTQGYSMEMRDAYVPNFSIGSGLGYSYGFPLGNPTIVNVNSQFLLFSFSQHDYIRSARAAWKAATLSLKNTRQQVILDASLNYIELNKTLSQVVALNEAIADIDKLLAIMNDRYHAGLETQIQMTQAQLTRAQVNLRVIQTEDHADEIRRHLSNLTGLSQSLITPAGSSVPQLPNLDFPALTRGRGNSPAVQAAAANADAKMFSAWGDEKQNHRPTVMGVVQYNLFSTFNGYSSYYKNFQQNNVAIGIQAVWPLFDRIRRDKSIESNAEAIHARQQAELDRIQNNESNFALWHSLRELEAQEQVATLQQQLAQDTLASTVTQLNGSTDTNSTPITPQQAEQQRIDERTSDVDLEDARFNVAKVKLNLLNAVGGLEDWAKQNGQPAAESVPAR